MMFTTLYADVTGRLMCLTRREQMTKTIMSWKQLKFEIFILIFDSHFQVF